MELKSPIVLDTLYRTLFSGDGALFHLPSGRALKQEGFLEAILPLPLIGTAGSELNTWWHDAANRSRCMKKGIIPLKWQAVFLGELEARFDSDQDLISLMAENWRILLDKMVPSENCFPEPYSPNQLADLFPLPDWMAEPWGEVPPPPSRLRQVPPILLTPVETTDPYLFLAWHTIFSLFPEQAGEAIQLTKGSIQISSSRQTHLRLYTGWLIGQMPSALKTAKNALDWHDKLTPNQEAPMSEHEVFSFFSLAQNISDCWEQTKSKDCNILLDVYTDVLSFFRQCHRIQKEYPTPKLKYTCLAPPGSSASPTWLKQRYLDGMSYYYGIQRPKDWSMAYRCFMDSQEYPGSATMLARLYYGNMAGYDRPEQSYETALEWHHRAAAKDDAYSLVQLAYSYAIGIGCQQDLDLALSYAQRANQLGDPGGLVWMGNAYETMGNYQKACECYETIADQNSEDSLSCEAALRLGLMYRDGRTPEGRMDHNRALRWLYIADKRGDTRATFEIGNIFFKPCAGEKADFKVAQRNFQDAADRGHVDAQYMLAFMLEHGHTAPPDDEGAIRWYRKAAQQGHELSMMQLSVLLAQKSAPESRKEAMEWCQKAAAHNVAESEYLLGLFYDQGIGCTPDQQQAIQAWTLASRHGNTAAALMLEQTEPEKTML